MGDLGRFGLVVAFATGVAWACTGADTFACAQDADCSGGVCAAEHCAFPDDGCESNLRYGDHAGPLAGLCVLPDDAPTGSAGTADTTGPDATTGGDGATSVAPGDSTGDGGPIATLPFVDDDEADFTAGTMEGVVYEGDRLRLAAPDSSGTFTSRIYDAGVDVAWSDLAWQPDAPYAKPLLDGGAAETGYPGGGLDMAGNVLLHHFEDPSPLSPGNAVLDASGHGHDGVIVGGTSSTTVPGVFGLAMEDNVDAYDSVPITDTDFDFGEAGYTWSIWFRFTHDCTTNNVFMGIEDIVGGGDLEEHLWMGCSDSVWSECPDAEPVVHAAGVMISQQGAAEVEGTYYCGRAGINDGQWHHMAVVRTDNATALTRLYVDGELDFEASGAYLQPIVFDNDPDLAIGAFTGETYDTSGTFDEAAIWTRPLSGEEVAALYDRGAARVDLEVRTCADATCSDDPPFRGGAGLVAGETFRDPPGATGPGTPVSVAALPPARFIQYRIRMEATAAASPPAIASVTLDGAPS